MLGVTGAESTIVSELTKLIPPGEEICIANGMDAEALRLDCDRYFIATGYLAGRALGDLTPQEAADTMDLNFMAVARICERIITANENARIVVMGSESGYRGSYDMAYACAKAALHFYVEHRQLLWPGQMLCAVAPHIIWDTNMTQQRDDREALSARGRQTRLGRWCTAAEVAGVVKWLLFDASPYMSNEVIRMEGGNGPGYNGEN